MGSLNYITTTAFPVIKIVRNNATEKPEQSSEFNYNNVPRWKNIVPFKKVYFSIFLFPTLY